MPATRSSKEASREEYKCATPGCPGKRIKWLTRHGSYAYHPYCSVCLSEAGKQGGRGNVKSKKSPSSPNAVPTELPFEEWPRKTTKEGYVLVRPNGTHRWRLEHRVVAEMNIGRPLHKWEVVHHKNGVRSENDWSNLEIWLRTHWNGQRATDITCPHCKKPYWPEG